MSRSIESVNFGNQTGDVSKSFGGSEGNRVSAQERKKVSSGGGDDVPIPPPFKTDPPKKAKGGSFLGRLGENFSNNWAFEGGMPHDYF
tara:strand:+ start:414 stop:677 length:264 start_codon:yes stop_codon:yes gene_type:complete